MNQQTEKLSRHSEQYIKLSDTLKSELVNRISFRSFKKGELIHDAGKICTHSYFIEKGFVRTYFIKDGKEISEYSCGAEEWVNLPRSFIQRTKDIYYIDAIENTDVFCLHVDELVVLEDSHAEPTKHFDKIFGFLDADFLKK